jgi:ATP-dependent DNA helicase RecG
MTDAELVALLRDPESDRVERKASLSDREKIREAICAFANDLPNHGKPGVIFVGVRDNGECANLTVSDELLRSLADMRGDGNILPFPTMIVQKRTLDGCELAVVIVYPSGDPPVRCRGRVWVRIGPRGGQSRLPRQNAD